MDRMKVTAMEKAIDLVKKAADADNDEKYDEALTFYEHAIDYFLHALKYEAHGPQAKDSIREKCREYLERADQIKKLLKSKPQGSLGEADKESKDRDSCDQATLIDSAVVVEKPNIRWGDIAGLAAAMETLKETIILPVRFPHHFTGKRKPQRSILLYGPPGTGKSSLAKAVATEAGFTLLSISCANLASKWFSKSKELLVKLFTLAKEKKPAIIFVGDVDSLCIPGSTSGETVTTQMIRTEFLDQMRSFIAADCDGITVLGATNAPWSLDTATRKCFEKRVHIPLPDLAARRRIFEICVGNTPTSMISHDYFTLSQKTEGYSGESIELVVKDALMMPLRKVQSATHFKKVRGPSPTDPQSIVDDLLTPCNPREHGAVEMNWTEVQGDKLLEPKLNISDVLKSLHMVSTPTVSASDLKLFEEFKTKYGHGQST